VEWGVTRGMPVGLGRSAEPVLMRALAESDAPVKLAAIHTLANIGDEAAIEPPARNWPRPIPPFTRQHTRHSKLSAARPGSRSREGKGPA
jgi:HEAT repeat protein